jgi:hypothetical protein
MRAQHLTQYSTACLHMRVTAAACIACAQLCSLRTLYLPSAVTPREAAGGTFSTDAPASGSTPNARSAPQCVHTCVRVHARPSKDACAEQGAPGGSPCGLQLHGLHPVRYQPEVGKQTIAPFHNTDCSACPFHTAPPHLTHLTYYSMAMEQLLLEQLCPSDGSHAMRQGPKRRAVGAHCASWSAQWGPHRKPYTAGTLLAPGLEACAGHLLNLHPCHLSVMTAYAVGAAATIAWDSCKMTWNSGAVTHVPAYVCHMHSHGSRRAACGGHTKHTCLHSGSYLMALNKMHSW